MTPAEKAVWEQFEADEAKQHQRGDYRESLDAWAAKERRNTAKAEAAKARAKDEENAAKVEALRVANIAALDERYRARELSIWRLSGRSDKSFEEWWPQRRGELARAEVDQHVSAVVRNFYSDF